jgi:hypothetical protein
MRMTRVLGWAGPASVAIWLAACGGGSDGPGQCPAGQTGVPPNCVAIAPVCTQSSVYSDSGGVEGKTLVYFDFSVPDTGRLDITLDWTHASSMMGVYLVPANTCTLDEFNAGSCNFTVRSDPPGPKPRKVSAPNLAAGNYRWIVANYSDALESIALQIVLSKGDCPALAGALPAASARESASALTVARAAQW